jgi:hypothetical protein
MKFVGLIFLVLVLVLVSCDFNINNTTDDKLNSSSNNENLSKESASDVSDIEINIIESGYLITWIEADDSNLQSVELKYKIDNNNEITSVIDKGLEKLVINEKAEMDLEVCIIAISVSGESSVGICVNSHWEQQGPATDVTELDIETTESAHIISWIEADDSNLQSVELTYKIDNNNEITSVIDKGLEKYVISEIAEMDLEICIKTISVSGLYSNGVCMHSHWD